ncbi:MAG: phenylacetate-CoA oxygenase subunit PaaC [Crocinitomicaceae bacterium]|nr:phenylacetate-CoA oxygenase subunit PaaC [Crocinitomicaceae bacterium]MDG2440743.1 phenylacetate-CoA oxygenase subunit PaaC [Crocinitomicaceae bacterium]|tara:strand:- start:1710 stop:2459 length:750 start_codon:yes stop_codon:yes gene_type:complete
MNSLFEYLIRLGDDSLILGHRMSEWCGHGPILEEDIAMTNISLDLIGQATNLLKYAGEVEGKGRDEDELAFLRFDRDYKNVLLVEQPNGDFGMTMMRQFLFDAYRKPLFEALVNSSDEQLSAIAVKSLKETKYHLKHSAEWVIRLGDGTEESKQRVQESLDTIWRYTDELFFTDDIEKELLENGMSADLEEIKVAWMETVNQVLSEATLNIPDHGWQHDGGRRGMHSEHLGYILAELQYMQRAYPGMEW